LTTTQLTDLKTDHYTLRLPQWSVCGLDERWLLQECGARHWDLLGEGCGVSPDQFADHSGHSVYASFFEIHLSGSLSIEYKERKPITVHSSLEIFDCGQSISFHQFSLGDGAGVTVQMKATFVRRQATDRKNRFVKELPRQLPRSFHLTRRLSKVSTAGPTPGQEPFTPVGETLEGMGEDVRSHLIATEAEFLPCPALDFNGVGLLYFARYHEFADRLEWMWLTRQGVIDIFAPAERKTHFLRNLDIGDSISASLLRPVAKGNALTHTAILRRNPDGKAIAVIETRKVRAEKRPEITPYRQFAVQRFQ
jgi:probable biosynthetic protein (TIGR04098 family)